MSKKDDFRIGKDGVEIGRPRYEYEAAGLTKRELFAMSVLPTVAAEYARCHREDPNGFPSTFYPVQIARECFRMADAMIAEGEKE